MSRKLQKSSLTFHLSHVDHAALWAEIEKTKEPKFRPLIAELKRKGEWPFPYDIFISVKGVAEDEAMINTMRLTEIDATDAASRCRGYVRGRQEAFKLTVEDLRKGTSFPDAIGFPCMAGICQIPSGPASSRIRLLKDTLRARGCIVDMSALPVVRPRVDP